MSRGFQKLCPKFQLAMAILAKPWNGLIMAALEGPPLRFGQLAQKLAPIGDRMLAARLKVLAEQGIVARKVLPGPPVRVEYTLTEAGHGFRQVQAAIGVWGEMLEVGPAAKKKAPKTRAVTKTAVATRARTVR